MHLSPAALDAAIRLLEGSSEAGHYDVSLVVEKYWRRRENRAEWLELLVTRWS
jgi:hypothetical protein